MDDVELFRRLSVALAIGLLVGLERGWRSRTEREGERAAGVRTFALSGLLGGVWGTIAERFAESGGAVALALASSVFAAAIVVFMLREAVHDKTYSATSAVAALLTFALGALAALGEMQAAAAGGVATAALLALRSMLHGWLKRITWRELRSGLVLLAMTFILLPMLPDRTIDPWGALNPHALWLMTILIAALSFAGYIAIKLTGDDRGILLTGIAGGLVSSTAVTLSLARFSRDNPGREKPLAAGMMAAGATMILRVLVVVALANWSLFERLGAPLGAAAAVQALGAIAMVRTGGSKGEGLAVSNPFDLATVLKFGALLTVITLAAKLTTSHAGHVGAYVLAAASGLADVDAITLSMARLDGSTITPAAGANAILIAVGVNTLVKAVLSWAAGGARIGRFMLIATAIALVAAIAARAASIGAS